MHSVLSQVSRILSLTLRLTEKTTGNAFAKPQQSHSKATLKEKARENET